MKTDISSEPGKIADIVKYSFVILNRIEQFENFICDKLDFRRHCSSYPFEENAIIHSLRILPQFYSIIFVCEPQTH